MTRYQGRTGRLLSGARLRSQVGKKKRMLGRAPSETGIGPEVRKKVRTLGGTPKYRLYKAESVNVVNTKTGKVQSTEILDVEKNPASRDYQRRRIITKGAILKTNLGSVRVSNRPGKEGFVNAVLLEE